MIPIVDIQLLEEEGRVQTKDQDNHYKLFEESQREEMTAYLAAGGIAQGAIADILARMGWS